MKLGNCIRNTVHFEKIEDLCHWDESTRTLYQTWGTDLLPEEINVDDYVRFDPSKKDIHYVGMMYEQGPYWIQYFILLNKRVKKFNYILNQLNIRRIVD